MDRLQLWNFAHIRFVFQDAHQASSAARLISKLFGPLLLHVVSTSLATPGLDLTRALLPALLESLAHGPSHLTSAGDRGPSLVARKRAHSSWRRQRAQLALEIGHLLRELRDPLKVPLVLLLSSLIVHD